MQYPVVEEHSRAGPPADLRRAGHAVLRVRFDQGLVAAGNKVQVALVGFGHVAQVIPYLELQQRNVRPEVTESVLDPVRMPASSVVFFGFDLEEGVRGMQVGHLVEQAVDVGHHRLVVEHVQKKRVFGQQVHDPRVGPAQPVGEGRFVRSSETGIPPAGDRPSQRGVQRIDQGFREEIFQYQVAVGVEEEAFGVRGMAGRGGVFGHRCASTIFL